MVSCDPDPTPGPSIAPAPPKPAFSATAPPTSGGTICFVLDTGASRHMTPLKHALFNLRPPPEDLTVTFGNGGQAKPAAEGDIYLEF